MTKTIFTLDGKLVTVAETRYGFSSHEVRRINRETAEAAREK